MREMMMELPVLLLLGVIVWKLRPADQEELGEYLSMQQTGCVKGILAVSIVMHHLAQQTQGGLLLPLFAHLGGMILSLFFFYSGYGVQKKNLTDGGYRRQFLRRRVSAVLVPYLFAALVYSLVFQYTAFQVLEGFANGDPVVRYSWYVIHILAFYLAFYLLMCCFGSKKLPMVLAVLAWSAGWAVLTKAKGFPAYWYGTSHLLVLGVAWASWETELTGFVKKHLWTVGLLMAALILLCFYYSRGEEGESLTKRFMYVCFAVLALCVLMKLRIMNPVLRFLGSISFELYLYHGLFITLFSRWNLPEPMFCLLVLSCSIVSAYGARQLYLMWKRKAGNCSA